jgi:hypothetical protein
MLEVCDFSNPGERKILDTLETGLTFGVGSLEPANSHWSNLAPGNNYKQLCIME